MVYGDIECLMDVVGGERLAAESLRLRVRRAPGGVSAGTSELLPPMDRRSLSYAQNIALRSNIQSWIFSTGYLYFNVKKSKNNTMRARPYPQPPFL